MQDPELPDDPDEKLYFCLVDLEHINSCEFRRISQLEVKGEITEEQLKAFKEAGGIFSGQTGEAGGLTARVADAQKLVAAPVEKKKKKKNAAPKAITNGENHDGKVGYHVTYWASGNFKLATFVRSCSRTRPSREPRSWWTNACKTPTSAGHNRNTKS